MLTTNVKVDITELEIEGQKLKGDFDFTFKDDGSILINLKIIQSVLVMDLLTTSKLKEQTLKFHIVLRDLRVF